MNKPVYVYYHYLYYSQYDETEKHGYILEQEFTDKEAARGYVELQERHGIDHNREWYSIEDQMLPLNPTTQEDK